MKLYLVCHFRGIVDANFKRGLNDTASTGKDKLFKAQLLSLKYINIDLHSKIVIPNRGLFMFSACFKTDADNPVQGAGEKNMYINHFLFAKLLSFLSLTNRVTFFLDIR